MNLKQRMASGERLVGTFIKTAAYEVIEVLAHSGLDYLILDGEHAPFDRARMDQCLAIGRALNFPLLVRTHDTEPSSILRVLDSGAVGVVVPHVNTVEKAASIAKSAYFGHGGRGFAGSTRWAGFATRTADEVFAQSEEETVVIVQIEEPEGVEAVNEIAAIKGVDGLFVGPADLGICYGTTDPNSDVVRKAIKATGDACKTHGKTLATFAANPQPVEALAELGVSMFCVGSEQSFMLQTARGFVADIKPKG